MAAPGTRQTLGNRARSKSYRQQRGLAPMVVRPHIPYSGGPEELMMAAHDPLAHDREDSVVATKRAVLYLRVSTPSQVNTDYNPEGISLPAQREACEPKASALDAEIIREFVEPGRSAATIDKRPVFQEMLAWIKEQGDIDYVIVYHFNRIFRNSIDAALTKRDLRKLGVRVVSTILDLGDGPEGDMVETILNAVDEYRSRADGADISYKMGAKARNGGTLGRAPLGYLNISGHERGPEHRHGRDRPGTWAARTQRLRAVRHRRFQPGITGGRTDPAGAAHPPGPLPIRANLELQAARHAARPLLRRLHHLQGR